MRIAESRKHGHVHPRIEETRGNVNNKKRRKMAGWSIASGVENAAKPQLELDAAGALDAAELSEESYLPSRAADGAASAALTSIFSSVARRMDFSSTNCSVSARDETRVMMPKNVKNMWK